MFTKSYKYYDDIYAFKNYAEASEKLNRLIKNHHPSAASLLDVACGSGRHVECLRQDYICEGLDINTELLAIAQARCPGMRFTEGDMRDFATGRKYDVITLLFSSVAYVKTVPALRSTITCLARHLAAKGVMFIEPWFAPENYWTGTITANHVDKPKLKICWMYPSDPPVDNIATLRMKFMVGTPQGVEVFDEVHELGLFSRVDWSDACASAGLQYEYDEKGLFGRGMYIMRSKS